MYDRSAHVVMLGEVAWWSTICACVLCMYICLHVHKRIYTCMAYTRAGVLSWQLTAFSRRMCACFMAYIFTYTYTHVSHARVRVLWCTCTYTHVWYTQQQVRSLDSSQHFRHACVCALWYTRIHIHIHIHKYIYIHTYTYTYTYTHV